MGDPQLEQLLREQAIKAATEAATAAEQSAYQQQQAAKAMEANAAANDQIS